MRPLKIPQSARRLRTYEEFESYLRDFVAGYYDLVWVVGRPGTGKSAAIDAAIRGRNCYYRKGGQLTPVRFYTDCYEHRGQPVILDDAEHLLNHPIGAKLVSALGETTPAKWMCYGTSSPALGLVPEKYLTTSRLCIIANLVTAHEAIQSRAVLLHFDPTNLEIHRAVARWFWDQAVHDWFGTHVCALPPLDTRWYVTAAEDRRGGRNWQQILLDTRALDRSITIVQAVEQDSAYPTREDKARRFLELMDGEEGASRASYYRLRRRLADEERLVVQTLAPIPLRRRKRPATPSRLELNAMEAPKVVGPVALKKLDLPVEDREILPLTGINTSTAPDWPKGSDDTLPGSGTEPTPSPSSDPGVPN
jgi:hypothetical protein